MATHCLKLLVLFLATTLLASLAYSTDHHNDEFLKCLEAQLEKSNSGSNHIIYTPKDASYATLLEQGNLRTAPTPSERPVLIITPVHESQIQAAIHCSKKTGLQIRVRSGGHDYEGLSYASENESPFVVVDMRNFRSVEVDTRDKTVWVEVGVTLGQLYYTIAQKSKTLAYSAGVCPTVGVGGHFSGGGYGMMSRQNAIAADHIIDAKLINAEGQILDRKSMGEDLFWAIRGGGGTSFGIVIAFKVELITIPETVTVFNVTRFSEQGATELVHKWQYVAHKLDNRILLRLFLASVRSPTGRNRTIEADFTTLFLGRADELVSIMEDKFPELGLEKKDCIEMSWIESTLYFWQLTGQPLQVLLNRTQEGEGYFKGKSDYVKEAIPINGLTGIWRFLHQAPEGTAQLQFSPYGGALNTYSASETPFPHRAGNIFMIHYGISWTRRSEAQRHINWMRSLYQYTGRYVSKSPRSAYFNYRDLDIGVNNKGNTSYAQASIWGLKYFNDNFKRLVRVKTKVDPTNFFRNEQSVPPLTSSW